MKLTSLWTSSTLPKKLRTSIAEGEFAKNIHQFGEVPVEIARDYANEQDEYDHDDTQALLNTALPALERVRVVFDRAGERLSAAMQAARQRPDKTNAELSALRGSTHVFSRTVQEASRTLQSIIAMLRDHQTSHGPDQGIGEFNAEVVRIARYAKKQLGTISNQYGSTQVPASIQKATEIALTVINNIEEVFGSMRKTRLHDTRPKTSGNTPATIVSSRGTTMKADHVVQGDGEYYYVCFGKRPQRSTSYSRNPRMVAAGLRRYNPAGGGQFNVWQKFSKIITIPISNVESIEWANGQGPTQGQQ